MTGDHPGHYLTAYLVGNLSPDGRRDVEAHLALCPACRMELASLGSTLRLVEAAVAPAGGPRELEGSRIERLLVAKARTVRPILWAGVAAAGLGVVFLMLLPTLAAVKMDRAMAPGSETAAMDRKQGPYEPPSPARVDMPNSGRRPHDGTPLAEEPEGEPGTWEDEVIPPGPSSLPEPAQDPAVHERDRSDLSYKELELARGSTAQGQSGANDDFEAPVMKPPMEKAAEEFRPANRREAGGDLGLLPQGESALESRLRAFQYYRGLDAGLEWRRFEAQDLAIPAPAMGDEGLGREEFMRRYSVEPFTDTTVDRESTFGMDVDTASFTRARAMLRAGRLPDTKQVRVEEFVNYFHDEFEADPDRVFSIHAEAGDSPFGGGGIDLLEISIKARELHPGERRRAILTLAIDTSGSMYLEDRLELVKRALGSLVGSLDPEDRVGIVAYSSHAYLVLPHTPARESSRILGAVESLAPHGESHVEAGLEMAYTLADEVYEPRALNRVILCSDGVATAGARGPEEILAKVKIYAARGIYLTTVGFGGTKYDDHLMESLADQGNGRYDYVGSPAEAATFFSGSLPGKLEVLARDAKIQVVFNPEVVSHYRLLGYENRDIEDTRFRDDTVDAGEVGPGTTVTALYEVCRRPRTHGELAKVHVRFHNTVTSQVEELEFPLSPGISRGQGTSERFRLLASVAETAELLKGNYWARDGSFHTVIQLLQSMSDESREEPAWREIAEVAGLAQKLAIEELSARK